jgi:hypothetical protein
MILKFAGMRYDNNLSLRLGVVVNFVANTALFRLSL